MRDRIILFAVVAAVGVIAVAAVAGAWSKSHRTVGAGAPTEASAPMSPHDMATKTGNMLPSEYWSHPF
jgi:hypothetical protein